MHPIHQESTVATAIDVSGLWFCPSCGDIHREPECPTPGEWFQKNTARVEAGVRLCACCSRTAVRSGTPFASFFCATCGPRVLEVNRGMGRLIIPICRDPSANHAIFPTPPDERRPARGAAQPLRFLGAQLERLEHTAHRRTKFLLDRLRILDGAPIALDRFLQEVVQLRHESFHAEAALELLTEDFYEYLIDVPSESPALAARVEKKALDFVRRFTTADAKRLLAKGPAVVHEVAREWSRRAGEEIQALPSCLTNSAILAQQRLGLTHQALEEAAVESFVRTYGQPKRPTAPAFPPRLAAMVLPQPGEEWPDFLPQACPTSARLVVGLEYTPANPDLPLSVYHLSQDRTHRFWILWTDVSVDDEGCMEPAPAAWCVRSGLSSADAAFLLLEASLKQDRKTHGMSCARPRFGMPGLLGEDLTDVLLDLVWQRC